MQKGSSIRRILLRTSVISALSVAAMAVVLPLFGTRAGFCDTAKHPVNVTSPEEGNPPPNIIIINADDLGYGDLGCYGGSVIRTPNIDRLAEEGMRFTDFCSSNAMCSPSRFGLLTGRYAQRVKLHYVLFPKERPLKRRAQLTLGHIVKGLDIVDLGAFSKVDGIPADEVTLAEALKKVGYRTGMVGKWHLGDYVEFPKYHPLKHGFDNYFGVPYSNDMHPYPLCRNEDVLEKDIKDQSKLTRLYTEEAIKIIEDPKETPFFLYFAHTFPHQPFFASEDFHGKSDAGRFGDTVEEVDWSVGQLLACLERNGIAGNTLIFFTSDNGPWYNGSPGELRGRKGQSYEGGFRVPMIARWPGRIAAGSVCRSPAMNIDLFPTCLSIAGSEPPSDRIIDGQDILPLLFGKEDSFTHEPLFFYHHQWLEGVRVGKWKYYRDINTYVCPKPLDRRIRAAGKGPPWLYDLEKDPGENYNLSSNYPEVGRELSVIMDEWEENFERNPKGLTKE